MAEIELKSVTKHFGKVVAVDDVSLHVKSGEFMVLVGPSGCGKTTIMRMIAGLERVTEGEIAIGGNRVNELSSGDRDVAMVFQNYALYSHFDVRRNLAFTLRARKVPKEEVGPRIERVASMLGLGDVLNRKPSQLSGGERQRVALGRAIIREPRAFLLDEPLSNLDAMLRLQTRKELIELTRELNSTVILVTHDQTEAMTMGHRIAVMNQGKILQVDNPDRIYSRPQNRFVAQFVGSPPMNFVTGRLVEEQGAFKVKAWGISLPGPVSLRGLNLDRVTVGIRPEDWQVGQNDGFPAEVDVVEHLGSEILVYASVGDKTVAFLVPTTSRPRVGDVVRLRPTENMTHFFNLETEERLNTGELATA